MLQKSTYSSSVLLKSKKRDGFNKTVRLDFQIYLLTFRGQKILIIKKKL